MKITPERLAQLREEQGAGQTWPVVFHMGMLEITDEDPGCRVVYFGIDGSTMLAPMTGEALWNWLCQRYPEAIFDTTGIDVPDFPPRPPMWCPSCAAAEPCWLHDPGEL